MKTTLDLPDDLMREAKIRAAIQGRKLKDVMAEAIRIGLFPPAAAQLQIRPVIVKDPELGHRVVQGPPNAPISKMTLGEILELEQDALNQEDLQRAGIPL